jgi:hypothetical protein
MKIFKEPVAHRIVSLALLLAGIALVLPIKWAPSPIINDARAELTCYTNLGQQCCWYEIAWPVIWRMCMENMSETPPIDPEG